MRENECFLTCIKQVGRHPSNALELLQNHVGFTDARGFIASSNSRWYFNESNFLKMPNLGTKVASITRTECIYVIGGILS